MSIEAEVADRVGNHHYRSILVPLDGSSFAEHALPYALAMARRTAADVRLVHIHDCFEPAHDPGLLAHVGGLNAISRDRRRDYLDDLATRIAKCVPVRVTSVVIEGRRVAQCLSAVANDFADMVVMATHARRWLARLVRGGMAATLIHRLNIPLLLVRGQATHPDLAYDPPLRHVLTALDGTSTAQQLLERVLALDSVTCAEHTLLRVVESVNGMDCEGPGKGAPACSKGGSIEALSFAQHLMDRYHGSARRIRAQLVHSVSSVASAIVSYAEAHDADLIAVAPRPRRSLWQRFRSSVTYDVLRATSRPLLVYCPQEVREPS